MVTTQSLLDKIRELIANRLKIDDFEEWFVSESWGYYDVRGGVTSDVISAVHHILHDYYSNDLEERRTVEQLAAAIRPFEVRSVVTGGVLSEAQQFTLRIGPTPKDLHWESSSMSASGAEMLELVHA